MEDAEIDRQIQAQILTDLLNAMGKDEIIEKYAVSAEQFLKIKENISRQANEKSDDEEITSHAARYFRNLAKEHKFTSTAEGLGLSFEQTKFLNQIVLGKNRPTYGIIFMLRRSISPAQWIYMENEKLPSPVAFNPLVEQRYPVYDFATRNELAKEKTLGHLFFDIIRKGRVLTKFCAAHNCTLLEAANFIYMKKHQNGDIRFTHRPTVPFIAKFKDVIHPDFWFVYPEEVTPRILREVRLSAEEQVARIRGY